MFLVDTEQGRIIDDDEIKRELAAEQPYGEWLSDNSFDIDGPAAARRTARRPTTRPCSGASSASATRTRTCASCSTPMAVNGEEPIGSMGTDTPLAVLSDQPRLLYDYFKQLFAQVTNPPLDAIREELVTSMESTIGPGAQPARAASRERAGRSGSRTRSSTTTSSRSCATSTLARLHDPSTLPMLYRAVAKAARACERALDELRARRQRGGRRRLHHPDPVGPRRRARTRAPIPSLLATAGVHHHLVRGARARGARSSSRRASARGAPLSRCSSATAPARSTRTSRSRPSTT